MIPSMIAMMISRKLSLARGICLFMGLGLFILVDTFITMVAANFLGAYLALALVALASWILVVFIFMSMTRHMKTMKAIIQTALYPEQEFRHIAGLGLALVFAMIPGFFTDLISLAIYILPIRTMVGSLLVNGNKAAWEETAQVLSSE